MSASKFNYMLGIAGTVAFAVTAVLAVSPRGLNLFEAFVMSLNTAIEIRGEQYGSESSRDSNANVLFSGN